MVLWQVPALKMTLDGNRSRNSVTSSGLLSNTTRSLSICMDLLRLLVRSLREPPSAHCALAIRGAERSGRRCYLLGMHRTSQRRAILQALEEAQGPLTPQEVLERAAAYHASLGLATVYRNLNSLAERGAVSVVHLPNESARYERARHEHHDHFSCDLCG